MLLTPELVVVGAAACLSTAVSSLTQVPWAVVDSWTVFRTDHRLTAFARVLHPLVDVTQHYMKALAHGRPLFWGTDYGIRRIKMGGGGGRRAPEHKPEI